MKSGELICKALIAGKADAEIQELLREAHPTSKAALSMKSCREQVAWYRSGLRRGHFVVSPIGELLDLRRKKYQGHPRYLKDNLGNPKGPNERDATPNAVGALDMTSLKSAFYQQLVEHVFIGEVLQEAWFGYRRTVEVLRAEVDSSGYDVVFDCDGMLRYVQLKTSKHDGKRRSTNVNIGLGNKPGGCVVWLLRETDSATRRIKLSYLYFGGECGERLPDLSGFPVVGASCVGRIGDAHCSG